MLASHPLITRICVYRISANSFCRNYSFLNLALFTVTFDLYFINLNSCRGNYSREETIQGRKLFAEIRYVTTLLKVISIRFYSIVHAADMKVKTKAQRQKQKQTRNSLGNMESLHLLLWLHSARTCLQVWGSFSWFDEPVEQKVEFHMGCPSG